MVIRIKCDMNRKRQHGVPDTDMQVVAFVISIKLLLLVDLLIGLNQMFIWLCTKKQRMFALLL
jgi:hypothetical protein